MSPEGTPVVPFANSINLSETVVFVAEAVVDVPVNDTSPEKLTLPVNVCPLSASDFNSDDDTALAAILTPVMALSAIFAVVTFESAI